MGTRAMSFRYAQVSLPAAWGISLLGMLLLIWISPGVGIIGRDGDPANLMYAAVVAVFVLGVLASRMRAGGMAVSMLAAALTQCLITVIALGWRLGMPYSGAMEILLLNTFFIALQLCAAWLFYRTAGRR